MELPIAVLILSISLAVIHLVPLALSIPTILQGRRNSVRHRSYEPSVSVIIPTHNEEKVISRCLESVLQQDYPKDRMQILVVDDASTDGTRGIVAKYTDYGVKLLTRKERFTKASALNYASKFVDGEVVAVFDADCSLESSCVKNAVSNFSDERVGGILGLPRPINIRQNWLTRVLSMGDFLRFFLEIVWSQYGANNFLVGECMFVRKKLLDEAGWFREDILLEDAYASMHILYLGYRIRLERRSAVWCEQPAEFKVFINQRRRWFRGAFQLMRLAKPKHPRSLSSMFEDVLTFLGRGLHVLPYYIPLSTTVLILLFAASYLLSPSSIATITSFVGVIASLLLALAAFTIYTEWRRDYIYLPVWLLVGSFTMATLVPVAFFEELLRRPVSYYKRPKKGRISH